MVAQGEPPALLCHADVLHEGGPFASYLAQGFPATLEELEAQSQGQDLSSRIIYDASITMSRGRDTVRSHRPPTPGSFAIALRNSDGALSAAGALIKGTAASIELDWGQLEDDGLGGDVWVEHTTALVTGYVDHGEHSPWFGDRSSRVSGVGSFQRLTDEGLRVTVPVYQSISIDAALRLVFLAADWAAGDLEFDTSDVLLDWFWVGDEPPWPIIEKLMATEGPGSALYEAGDGHAVFKSRSSRFTDSVSTTSQATFVGKRVNDTYLVCTEMQEDDGVAAVINDVTVNVTRLVAAPLDAVWSFEATNALAIAPNQVITLTAHLSRPSRNIQPLSYVLSSGSLSVVPALSATSGSVVQITLTAGASGATLTSATLLGVALVEAETTAIRSRLNTAESVGLFGRRQLSIDLWPYVSNGVAQGIADLIALRYQGGRRLATLTVESVGMGTVGALDNATFSKQRALDIGHRITVSEDNLPIARDYWIEHIEHEWTGQRWRTTYRCEELFDGLGFGPFYGTASQQLWTTGTLAWTNASYAGADDAASATAPNTGASAVTELLITSLAAATRVPAGAVVDGVVVGLDAWDAGAVSTRALTAPATVTEGTPAQWTTPSNAAASDNARAGSLESPYFDGTHYRYGYEIPGGTYYAQMTPLLFTNFFSGSPFSVGVDVLGVEVEVEGRSTSYGRFFIIAQLMYNGEPIGTPGLVDYGLVLGWIPKGYLEYNASGDMVTLFGSVNDDWNAGLNDTILNSTSFGVRLSFEASTAISTSPWRLEIDSVRMRITYRQSANISYVYLLKNGIVQQGVNRGTGLALPVAPSRLEFGGNTDKWGGLDRATINAAGFGAAVGFTVPNGGTVHVNVIDISPIYHIPVLDQPVSWRALIVGDGPLAWWRFSEGSGATAYDEMGVSDGTYEGNVVWVPGHTNDGDPALRFQGAESVNIPDVASLDFAGTQAFTVEAIVTPSASGMGTARRIIDKQSGTPSDGWGLTLSTGNLPQLARRTGAGPGGVDTCAGAAALVAETTYHIVGTYDGTDMRVYVNGVLAGGPSASSSSLPGNTANVRIGRAGWTATQFLKGQIDDVILYTRALSAAEVLEHAQALYLA